MKNIFFHHFFLIVFLLSSVCSEEFLRRVTRGAQRKKDRLVENEDKLEADDVFMGKTTK